MNILIIGSGAREHAFCWKLAQSKKTDKISEKEIFGPVVCIYAYDNLNEAIEEANLTEVSFQASIFSNEIKEVLNFYEKINASSCYLVGFFLVKKFMFTTYRIIVFKS